MKKKIFVFGSNLAGRHGKGSALEAMKNWGAKYGCGMGRQGNSYAIPTKDHELKSLSLMDIEFHVNNFLKYARENKHLEFHIVAIGCGLAGYHSNDIAPMFGDAPENCILPSEFR